MAGLCQWKPPGRKDSGWVVSVETTGSKSIVCLVVSNATFNNISVISWRSVLLVEETGEP